MSFSKPFRLLSVLYTVCLQTSYGFSVRNHVTKYPSLALKREVLTFGQKSPRDNSSADFNKFSNVFVKKGSSSFFQNLVNFKFVSASMVAITLVLWPLLPAFAIPSGGRSGGSSFRSSPSSSRSSSRISRFSSSSSRSSYGGSTARYYGSSYSIGLNIIIAPSNGFNPFFGIYISIDFNVLLIIMATSGAYYLLDKRISYWRFLGAASSDNGDGSGGDEVVCAVGGADDNDNDDDQHSPAHSQLSLSTLTTDLRHHETAFACLIAEAVKYSYRDYGCQIGIQNGGFIRRDSTYKMGTVLRASDLREELPFPRTPVLIRMKGCDIKLALEQMIARCPAPVGSFPHLSDGWEAEYDLTQPAMQRIRAIKYLDSAISMEDSFLLAITDFYAEKGGDGVDAYMNKEVVAAHGRTVCDCALEYFKGKQTISGKLPLRFVDKSLQ